VRHLLRPLGDIQAGAQRFGRGDFSQPIPLARHDELGALAAQVNAMATSLQHMLAGQRGLLLAISHELRSPLTRARLHAELLDEGAQRDALLRDLGLMRDLVSDLLEGERLAAGPAALQRAPVDLDALVQSLVDDQFAGRGITLRLAGGLPLLQADRVRLQLLLRNLLDNALRHGGGTPVELSTAAHDRGCLLTVRDHGPGIDPAALARLGEPFFRPDAARSRSAGGVGLGLYLCRLVAQSHGGTLQWRDAAPGLAVSCWLPGPGGGTG
jgi:signal transduction histidine kinase